MKPESVTRAALRYINRLDLPLPLKDFKDYLRTVPEVSPSLPQGLSGFFMQLHIPQEDLDALAVINETIVPPRKPDTVSVILDIDLFKEKNLGLDEAWSMFDRFHVRKNEIFEGCITDRARELFK